MGYTYKVKDSDGDIKRRRYKPNELQAVGNVENQINRARMQRDEAAEKKYKTANKLVRNEEMTRTQARKAVKTAESDALGPARNTRNSSCGVRNIANLWSNLFILQIRQSNVPTPSLAL